MSKMDTFRPATGYFDICKIGWEVPMPSTSSYLIGHWRDDKACNCLVTQTKKVGENCLSQALMLPFIRFKMIHLHKHKNLGIKALIAVPLSFVAMRWSDLQYKIKTAAPGDLQDWE